MDLIIRRADLRKDCRDRSGSSVTWLWLGWKARLLALIVQVNGRVTFKEHDSRNYGSIAEVGIFQAIRLMVVGPPRSLVWTVMEDGSVRAV